MKQKPAKKGTLNFTVDYPALYAEFINDANIVNVGAGGAMGLRLVLLGLKEIALLALRDNHGEILQELSDLGIIVDEDGNYLVRKEETNDTNHSHG